MLGETSLTGRSSLFLRGEVWTVLTTASQLSASHFKRCRGSDKCGAVFWSIDDLPACFCMGRCLCLEPILPVAALWHSTCKPYSGCRPARSASKRTFGQRVITSVQAVYLLSCPLCDNETGHRCSADCRCQFLFFPLFLGYSSSMSQTFEGVLLVIKTFSYVA